MTFIAVTMNTKNSDSNPFSKSYQSFSKRSLHSSFLVSFGFWNSFYKFPFNTVLFCWPVFSRRSFLRRSFPRQFFPLALFPAVFFPAGLFPARYFPRRYFLRHFQARIYTDDNFLKAGIGLVSFVLARLDSVRTGKNWFG